jgi:leader peptidase (prepilin peptidase)/N-methyltransferase
MDLAVALLLGLAIGSFLNVCIARIPERRSIVSPPSTCPHCRQAIAWYDNVPVLAYLWLGGRCRSCRASISARYPLVEAGAGLISVLLFFRYGLGPEWGIYFAFCCAMIVLLLIDLDHRILPDVITLNGVWMGVVVSLYLAQASGFASRILGFLGADTTSPYVVALTASVLGMIFGGGLLWIVREAFFRLRGVQGMGLGDVKMMAMVGAFLGVPLTLMTILLGSVVGSIVGILVIRVFGKSRQYQLPFGTFLGAGAIIAVLYGDALLGWYLSSFMPPIR